MSLFKKIFAATFAFTVVCWSAAWICLAVAGESTEGTVKKLGSRLNQGTWANEKETFDFAGIQNLTIDAAAANVTIEKIEGPGQVTVEYSGMVKNGGKILRTNRDGSELKIALDPKQESGFVLFHTDDEDDDDDNNDGKKAHATVKGLKITVPADLAKVLRINLQSGDVTLKNLNAEDFEIHTVSGEIEITGGGVKREAKLSTVSGEIELKNFSGKVQATSTSGDIEAEHFSGAAFAGNSTSGNISVKMPDAMGWKFSLSTTSGEIKNEYADDAKADKVMQLRSTSGDIRVRR